VNERLEVMATISPGLVKKLRERTGAGMMDCKKALQEADGKLEAAVKILHEQSKAIVAKKAGRATGQGVVHAYIHGGRIGVLVEVNCETDFVARNEKFKQFVHELGLQIASMDPQYVSKEEVSKEAIQGDPKAFYTQACLLSQPFIKDQSKTIQDLLQDVIATTGENIVIRRFVRYEVGEEIESSEAQET
tara:strand:- start:71 stop:640 length:570 start_codon:yes stop_codon:yes gene_type:complete